MRKFLGLMLALVGFLLVAVDADAPQDGRRQEHRQAARSDQSESGRPAHACPAATTAAARTRATAGRPGTADRQGRAARAAALRHEPLARPAGRPRDRRRARVAVLQQRHGRRADRASCSSPRSSSVRSSCSACSAAADRRQQPLRYAGAGASPYGGSEPAGADLAPASFRAAQAAPPRTRSQRRRSRGTHRVRAAHCPPASTPSSSCATRKHELHESAGGARSQGSHDDARFPHARAVPRDRSRHPRFRRRAAEYRDRHAQRRSARRGDRERICTS